MKIPEPVKLHILRRVYQMATGRRDSQEWDEAWEHIKEHLSEGAGKQKASHSVFLKRFRSREKVAELVARAASKPSDSEFSNLTGPDGSPTGPPCLIFRRWFNEDIGESNGAMIQTLWVVALMDGKLITAYPKHHPHPGQR
jgi:hypothetical protein